nr:hypothetical protein [Tanacetum cinerariifolium]
MIVESIENGRYVRRMIATPGEPDLPVLERVREMMKGSYIGDQEKKAKLFNEWENFTSTDRESIESYYHRFTQFMNDPKRNKHFPENTAANLKFLNNLQLEWKRHVTIVRQTKKLHKADFTQIYDFLKMNQDENDGNQNGLVVVPGIANQNGTGNIVAARAEGIQLQAEEFNFMAAAGDLDEIEEVNANCILMVNLHHASTSGTQLDQALVYDIDGSAEYTDQLEPIPEPQLVQQNDNHVTYVAPSMVQSEGTVETSSAPNEETRAHQETYIASLSGPAVQQLWTLYPGK